MKCPFAIPVEKEMSTQDASGKTYYRIIDRCRSPHMRSITAGLTEKNADYIVQVINNHERLVDLLTRVKGRYMRPTDSLYVEVEQALKQAEKP